MACSRIFCSLPRSNVSHNIRSVSILGPLFPNTPADKKKEENTKPTHTGQVSILAIANTVSNVHCTHMYSAIDSQSVLCKHQTSRILTEQNSRWTSVTDYTWMDF